MRSALVTIAALFCLVSIAFAESNYSFSIFKAEQGAYREVYSQNEDVKLAPGSLVKLLTGVFFLNDFSQKEIWTSGIYLKSTETGTDIYLKGSGNCFLDETELEKLVRQLSGTGDLPEIHNIIVDDSYFTEERTKVGSDFTSPDALGLNLHVVEVFVDKGKGKKLEIKTIPDSDHLRFVVTEQADNKQQSEIQKINDGTYKISLRRVEKQQLRQHFFLDDPALFAGHIFRSLLRRNGIVVHGKVLRGKLPEGSQQIAIIPGPDRQEILEKLNVHSLNVVADNLLLAMASEKYGAPGTFENGIYALKEFIQSLKLPLKEIEIHDGSGLDNRNRITTNFMNSLLTTIIDQPWFDEFKDSLPRPGHEGTVKNLPFKDERFRVKSGRLENAYALAGYGIDGAGEEVVFTFIVNKPGIGLTSFGDQIGTDVLQFINTTTFADPKTSPRFYSKYLH